MKGCMWVYICTLSPYAVFDLCGVCMFVCKAC